MYAAVTVCGGRESVWPAEASMCEYRWVCKHTPTATLEVPLGPPPPFTWLQRLMLRPLLPGSVVQLCGWGQT
jgi:hypothetical protein